MDVVSLLGEGIVQGLVLGVVFGLLLKLATKAVKTFLLVFFLAVKWLEARHIVIVDWHRLTNGVLGSEELVINQATELVESLIEMGAFGAALGGGFYLAHRLAK